MKIAILILRYKNGNLIPEYKILLLVTAVGTNGDQDDDEHEIENGDEDDNEGESNLEKCAQLAHFSMSIV